ANRQCRVRQDRERQGSVQGCHEELGHVLGEPLSASSELGEPSPRNLRGYGGEPAKAGEPGEGQVSTCAPHPALAALGPPSPHHSASKTRVNALMAGRGGGGPAGLAPPPAGCFSGFAPGGFFFFLSVGRLGALGVWVLLNSV